MVLAELFSLALYLISLFVLHEYFGKFLSVICWLLAKEEIETFLKTFFLQIGNSFHPLISWVKFPPSL